MDILKKVDSKIEKFKQMKYENIDYALIYINDAMKICKDNKLEDKLQECRYHYGAALFDKGKWQESLNISMNIRRQIDEKGEKYVSKIQNNLTLGIYYFSTGNYEISLEYYLEGLEEAEKKNDIENMAKLKTNISEIYRMLKEYEKSKEYLDEILIYEKSLTNQSLGVIYTNYAEILTEIGDSTSALNFLGKSDDISREINDKVGIAYNDMIRGRIYCKKKDYINAEKYFLRSIDLFNKVKDGVYIFEAYDNYIELLIINNRLDEAESIIKEAYRVLDGKESIITEIKLEKYLAIINYKRGNYKEAVDKYKSYDRIYDVYDDHVLKMRLLAVETKFDIIKAQKERKRIERYNKELEEKHDVFLTATEIIKEINSSLNLKDVVAKVHHHLKIAIPLDVFGLALYSKEKGKINYKEYVEGGKRYGDRLKPIDINSRKNFTAYAIRNNKDIHLRTMDDKSKYVEDIILEPFNKISETVIFKRLVFEGEILGVLTVQSYEKDIYDRRHTAIIDLITPYLAIAVNNSIKSHNLEKEIKEREKAEEKLKEKNDILREISNTDSLTTLHNRHYLNKIMDNLFGIENIKGKNINLIMVDIDFFKEYNDTYGHIAGDEAISKIGRKIKEICEKNCIDAFRYGGDEFLIIDYDYSLNELRALGEKVNREVENLKINNLKSPISDYITVSIGITQVELENECNQDKLIKKVDNALYESKRIGKNKVTFL